MKGKRVLVVGLGASGLAAAKLCLTRGAQVTGTDSALSPAGAAELAQQGAELTLGGHRRRDFLRAHLVVLSPGVDPRLPVVAAAAEAGAEVIGEMELAFRFIEAPCALVTGTNGKSTVTTVLGQMLAEDGQQVFLGGNLGTPLCELALSEGKKDWAVCEVSSFQADTANSLRPKVGVLLNISPDHLDRYRSFEDYADSKLSMFARQDADDLAILAADDPPVAERAGQVGGRVWFFGADAPHIPGGWLRGQEMALEDGQGPPVVLGLAGSKLKGEFNRVNLLAAALAAHACGAGAEAMQQVIDRFAGLPHRLQWVAEVEQVDYYDDSKGTNPGAVAAALTAFRGPVVLLLGGRDKEGRFAPLSPHLLATQARVICFGEAGPRIAAQISGAAGCQVVSDLPAAVAAASAEATPGSAVLLSPGCASFDAYKNYAQRGDHFQRLVREAAGE